MIEIYLCEDEAQERGLLTRYVRAILEEDRKDFPASDICWKMSSDRPEEILEAAARSKEQGLFFLDIFLEGSSMDGLQLAAKLREIKPRCYIVFITGLTDRIGDTFRYKLEALDYILKEDTDHLYERMKACMENVCQKQIQENRKPSKQFPIMIGKMTELIPMDEILYLETSTEYSHQLILHTQTRSIRFAGQLKEQMKQLDEHFFQCHRSFVVNLNQIRSIDYDACSIVLRDDTEIPLSRRTAMSLKRKFAADRN